MFDGKQIQIFPCEGCNNLNGDIGRDSLVIEIDIPEVTCELSEKRPCQSCSVGDEININCSRLLYIFPAVSNISYIKIH